MSLYTFTDKISFDNICHEIKEIINKCIYNLRVDIVDVNNIKDHIDNILYYIRAESTCDLFLYRTKYSTILHCINTIVANTHNKILEFIKKCDLKVFNYVHNFDFNCGYILSYLLDSAIPVISVSNVITNPDIRVIFIIKLVMIEKKMVTNFSLDDLIKKETISMLPTILDLANSYCNYYDDKICCALFCNLISALMPMSMSDNNSEFILHIYEKKYSFIIFSKKEIKQMLLSCSNEKIIRYFDLIENFDENDTYMFQTMMRYKIINITENDNLRKLLFSTPHAINYLFDCDSLLLQNIDNYFLGFDDASTYYIKCFLKKIIDGCHNDNDNYTLKSKLELIEKKINKLQLKKILSTELCEIFSIFYLKFLNTCHSSFIPLININQTVLSMAITQYIDDLLFFNYVQSNISEYDDVPLSYASLNIIVKTYPNIVHNKYIIKRILTIKPNLYENPANLIIIINNATNNLYLFDAIKEYLHRWPHLYLYGILRNDELIEISIGYGLTSNKFHYFTDDYWINIIISFNNNVSYALCNSIINKITNTDLLIKNLHEVITIEIVALVLINNQRITLKRFVGLHGDKITDYFVNNLSESNLLELIKINEHFIEKISSIKLTQVIVTTIINLCIRRKKSTPAIENIVLYCFLNFNIDEGEVKLRQLKFMSANFHIRLHQANDLYNRYILPEYTSEFTKTNVKNARSTYASAKLMNYNQ
jgi:hypothetical protein